MDRSRRTPRHVRSQQVMDGIIESPRGAGGTEALFPLEIITLLGTSPCIERARLARPRPHLICIDRHKNGRPGPPSILRSAKARQVDRRRTKKMDDGGRWNRAHPQRTARPGLRNACGDVHRVVSPTRSPARHVHPPGIMLLCFHSSRRITAWSSHGFLLLLFPGKPLSSLAWLGFSNRDRRRMSRFHTAPPGPPAKCSFTGKVSISNLCLLQAYYCATCFGNRTKGPDTSIHKAKGERPRIGMHMISS